MTLEFAGETVTIGLISEEPLLDTSSSTIKHVITRQMIERLPF